MCKLEHFYQKSLVIITYGLCAMFYSLLPILSFISEFCFKIIGTTNFFNRLGLVWLSFGTIMLDEDVDNKVKS